MEPLLDFSDIVWVEPDDLRAVLTSGAWHLDSSDREWILSCIATASWAAGPEIRQAMQRALGDKEWDRTMKIREARGPVRFRDIEIAQSAIAYRLMTFAARGRLRINEEARRAGMKIRNETYARNFAQSLIEKFGRKPTAQELESELRHIEDDEYRALIVRFCQE